MKGRWSLVKILEGKTELPRLVNGKPYWQNGKGLKIYSATDRTSWVIDDDFNDWSTLASVQYSGLRPPLRGNWTSGAISSGVIVTMSCVGSAQGQSVSVGGGYASKELAFDADSSAALSKVRTKLVDKNDVDAVVVMNVGVSSEAIPRWASKWVFAENSAYAYIRPWWLALFSGRLMLTTPIHHDLRMARGFCPHTPALNVHKLGTLSSLFMKHLHVKGNRDLLSYLTPYGHWDGRSSSNGSYTSNITKQTLHHELAEGAWWQFKVSESVDGSEKKWESIEVRTTGGHEGGVLIAATIISIVLGIIAGIAAVHFTMSLILYVEDMRKKKRSHIREYVIACGHNNQNSKKSPKSETIWLNITLHRVEINKNMVEQQLQAVGSLAQNIMQLDIVGMEEMKIVAWEQGRPRPKKNEQSACRASNSSEDYRSRS